MPTAMRGTLGSSLASPASRAAWKLLRSSIRFIAILPQHVDLTLQSALIHVTQDVVVDLDHRRQRALSEAGHRAQREFAVGRRGGHLVGAALVVPVTQPELQLDSLQKRPRAPRMARRAAADADRVLTLRRSEE